MQKITLRIIFSAQLIFEKMALPVGPIAATSKPFSINRPLTLSQDVLFHYFYNSYSYENHGFYLLSR